MAGDHARLAARIAEVRSQDDDEPWAICLNSPGGVLSEALRMAADLHRYGIGTVVDDGNICLSACALMFMMGTEDWEIVRPSRKMHVTARLGFHRPELRSSSKAPATPLALTQSFDLAIEASLAFLRLANTPEPGAPHQPMIAPRLIEAFFARRGQDFLHIETVEQAGRWGIDVFGFDAPDPDHVSPAEMYQACLNIQRWSDVPATLSLSVPDAFWLAQTVRQQVVVSDPRSGANVDVSGHREVRFAVDLTLAFDRRADELPELSCVIELSEYGFWICGKGSGDVPLLRRVKPCRFEDGAAVVARFDALPTFALYPPDTRIADLAHVAAQTAQGAKNISDEIGRTPPLSCRPQSGQAFFVRKVQSFTNLRAAPGFAQPVLAEVPLGTVVRASDRARRVVGAPTAVARCTAACEAYDALQWWGFPDDINHEEMAERASLLPDIAACVAENTLWWPVRTREGEEGWISARYLH